MRDRVVINDYFKKLRGKSAEEIQQIRLNNPGLPVQEPASFGQCVEECMNNVFHLQPTVSQANPDEPVNRNTRVREEDKVVSPFYCILYNCLRISGGGK